MSHFAKVENGIVTQVIVAEQDFIDSGVVGDSAMWIQTSYNTRGGIHLLGGTPLRMNYAGIGYTYNPTRDAFIPPKPFSSWWLNENTCLWEAPIPYPTDGQGYTWNEGIQTWERTVVSESLVEATKTNEIIASVEVVVDVLPAEATIAADTSSATPTI